MHFDEEAVRPPRDALRYVHKYVSRSYLCQEVARPVKHFPATVDNQTFLTGVRKDFRVRVTPCLYPSMRASICR